MLAQKGRDDRKKNKNNNDTGIKEKYTYAQRWIYMSKQTVNNKREIDFLTCHFMNDKIFVFDEILREKKKTDVLFERSHRYVAPPDV